MEFISDAMGSIENYCEAVRATLQYWLDIHTDPEMWAEEWSLGGDYVVAFRDFGEELSNDYFTFDWGRAARRRAAIRATGDFVRCPACGVIETADSVGDICECCGAEVEEWDDVPERAMLDYFEDMEIEPSESDIEESLVQDGFNAYREGIADTTGPVEEDIKETLSRLESDDPHTRLVAVLYGTRLWHVNGEVIRDYAYMVTDLEDWQVESVRDNGLEEFFDADDLKEFLEG